ncbi:MAG TPA: phosphatase PAP2 family protein [Steroidobacteraceae bacterium]|nr:phosphatase PAP2 family protein [Steroidobacteraceae bacterium]
MTGGKPYRATLLGVFAVTILALGWVLYHYEGEPEYLNADRTAFVALFAQPPPADSPQTRAELDALLEVQRKRSARDVEAARADRKTEIQRFYVALGFPEGADPDLPLLQGLAENVEDDARPYVRAAKEKFRRLRPYEIEPRMEPCIDRVRGDLSYPSGHANYGYLMADLLRAMVPERERQLLARADEFARQRMVCGVHFASDIEAGREGASWLMTMLNDSAEFRNDANAAMAELRAALKLPPRVLPPR